MVVQEYSAGVFTIENLLSDEACQAYIRRCEVAGFEQTLVAADINEQDVVEFRNNDRAILDDTEIADLLYRKVQVHLDGRTDPYTPLSANERVRFYRYKVGQQFEWHSDGCYVNASGEQSRFTFLVYLNEGFAGGQTCFRLPAVRDVEIEPRAGMALIFPHHLLHKARAVTAGTKYVLRTDIMCQAD